MVAISRNRMSKVLCGSLLVVLLSASCSSSGTDPALEEALAALEAATDALEASEARIDALEEEVEASVSSVPTTTAVPTTTEVSGTYCGEISRWFDAAMSATIAAGGHLDSFVATDEMVAAADGMITIATAAAPTDEGPEFVPDVADPTWADAWTHYANARHLSRNIPDGAGVHQEHTIMFEASSAREALEAHLLDHCGIPDALHPGLTGAQEMR